MAGSMNLAIIIGNVGKDPEVRTMQDGTRIANFSVATSESWTDKASGERKDKVEWHRVASFNDRTSEAIEKYVRKGSKVAVRGQIQTRKWTDQSGAEKYTTEIIIGRFDGSLTLLGDPAGGDGERGNAASAARPQARSSAPARGAARPAAVSGGWDAVARSDLDDDIPF